MIKYLGAAAIVLTFALSTPAHALGNNETPAQLQCSNSSIAYMILKTSGIRGEDARRAALKQLDAANVAMKAKRRAECIARVQDAMKFFGN